MLFIRAIIWLILEIAVVAVCGFHANAQQGTASTVMGWAPDFGIRTDSVPTPYSPGSGYAVGDLLTLNDGCPTHGVVRAETVGAGGALLTYSINNIGFCKFLAYVAIPITVLSTTGNGSGATIHVRWGLINQAPGPASTIANGLVATGSTQATAYPLTTAISIFTSVGPNTGAVLQNLIGVRQDVYNNGLSPLNIYPFSSAAIMISNVSQGVNVASVLLPGGHASFVCQTSTQCYAGQ